MKLSSILNTARNGELKGLSAKDKPDNVIIDFINMAIVAIHDRFVLNVQEAVIDLVPGKTIYTLNKGSADVLSGVVKATYNKREFSRIIRIVDNLGNEVSINNYADKYTAYFPTYDTMQVKEVQKDVTQFVVTFCTMPVEIPLDADESYSVEIPRFLMEPLMHYVGYRAHGSVDGNIDGENNTHLMRFKMSCDEIEAKGLIPGDNTTRDVDLKGFGTLPKGFSAFSYTIS
jgi:hypothetical protein